MLNTLHTPHRPSLPRVKETNTTSESSTGLRQSLDTSGMEATHQAFSELLENMAHADNDVFPARFQALLALTRLHIAEEGWLMRASRYPALAEHESEHHRMLGELVQLNLSLKRGRIALVRAYVKDGLTPWFGLHLATMDAALEAHLRRQAG